MLKLPVPEAVYEDVVLKPSEYQQEMVESLADRAQAVRDRLVDPSQDNMLRISVMHWMRWKRNCKRKKKR